MNSNPNENERAVPTCKPHVANFDRVIFELSTTGNIFLLCKEEGGEGWRKMTVQIENRKNDLNFHNLDALLAEAAKWRAE